MEHVSGGARRYDVIDPRDAPNDNGGNAAFGNMGPKGKNALRELFGRHDRGDDDSDWTSSQAIAFQLAVREIAYEFGADRNFSPANLNVDQGASNRGRFYATNATSTKHATAANALVASLDGTGPRWTLRVLSSPHGPATGRLQDQVTWIVPVPTALSTGVGLLLGIWFVGRRRRRT